MSCFDNPFLVTIRLLTSAFCKASRLVHLHLPVIALAALLSASCSEKKLDIAQPRDIMAFEFPDDFRPSKRTVDEDGVTWGLFVSRILSGKDNIWAVRSTDGRHWSNPHFLMTAYVADNVEFAVAQDTFLLTFQGLGRDYFLDAGLSANDTSVMLQDIKIRISFEDCLRDEDHDGLADVVENELFTSPRLPDSDLDGKPDNMDPCPLAAPTVQSDEAAAYRAAVETLFRLDNEENLTPRQDSAWTRFYGVYYVVHPATVFLSLPGETEIPEFPNFPSVVIDVRSTMFFSNRAGYDSQSSGVVPHLVLLKPDIDFAGKRASMEIVHVLSQYRKDAATLSLSKSGEKWSVEGITVHEK